jgi:hypothetical protein
VCILRLQITTGLTSLVAGASTASFAYRDCCAVTVIGQLLSSFPAFGGTFIRLRTMSSFELLRLTTADKSGLWGCRGFDLASDWNARASQLSRLNLQASNKVTQRYKYGHSEMVSMSRSAAL